MRLPAFVLRKTQAKNGQGEKALAVQKGVDAPQQANAAWSNLSSAPPSESPAATPKHDSNAMASSGSPEIGWHEWTVDGIVNRLANREELASVQSEEPSSEISSDESAVDDVVNTEESLADREQLAWVTQHVLIPPWVPQHKNNSTPSTGASDPGMLKYSAEVASSGSARGIRLDELASARDRGLSLDEFVAARDRGLSLDEFVATSKSDVSTMVSSGSMDAGMLESVDHSTPASMDAGMIERDDDSTSLASVSSDGIDLDEWMDGIGNTDYSTADRENLAWVRRQVEIPPYDSQHDSHSAGSCPGMLKYGAGSAMSSGCGSDREDRVGNTDNSMADREELSCMRKQVFPQRFEGDAEPLLDTPLMALDTPVPFGPPGWSLMDDVRREGTCTFLLKELPRTLTADAIIGEFEKLGCADFDFLRMPVSNGDKAFRGFAIIIYPNVEAALRFVYSTDGRVFPGGLERSTVEVAATQGVVANLGMINWNRRRRRNTHVCERMGHGANGLPLVRVGGEVRQIVTKEDFTLARAAYE